MNIECSDDDIAQDTKLQKSDRSRSSADTYQSLTGRDLLHFALQIATGMVSTNMPLNTSLF